MVFHPEEIHHRGIFFQAPKIKPPTPFESARDVPPVTVPRLPQSWTLIVGKVSLKMIGSAALTDLSRAVASMDC